MPISFSLPEYILDVLDEEAIMFDNVKREEIEEHHFYHNDKDKGILICGSGSGMCIVANKIDGIRAVNCYSKEIASLAVRHNDVNVLCLGARFVSKELAKEIVDIFLNEKFEGGRHFERVNTIHLETE